jgi:hypothetical protein
MNTAGARLNVLRIHNIKLQITRVKEYPCNWLNVVKSSISYIENLLKTLFFCQPSERENLDEPCLSSVNTFL